MYQEYTFELWFTIMLYNRAIYSVAYLGFWDKNNGDIHPLHLHRILKSIIACDVIILKICFKNSSWNNEIFVEYQKTFRYILWEYASYILMGFFDVRPYFALVLKLSDIMMHLNVVYINLIEHSVLKSVHNVHCQNTRNTFSRFF